MPFEFIKQTIPELVVIKPRIFNDDRGYFLETYKKSDFVNNGISVDFHQANHSRSQKNVVRALHYQLPPFDQGKLVRVVKGKIWDVAVDVRKNSPTFKKWVAVELDDQSFTMFYIPPGFAHGFAALTDDVHLLYQCTNEYSKDHERGIIWNDPELAINWPVSLPIISEKDALLPLLKDADIFE